MSNNQKPNQEPHKMPTVGLDESPLSGYAKAVNAVRSNRKSSHIFMGYAPPLLRVLTNIDNLRTYTHYKDLRKAMLGEGRNSHFVPAKVMLQLPCACNNTVGILKSSDKATDKGFVFLTDLQERGMPLIAIFHRDIVNDHYTLSMPTAYGREYHTFQNFLNYDILCWDYSKAERFEQMYSEILDLPKHIYPTKDFGKQQRALFSTEIEPVPDSLSPLHMASQLLSHNSCPLFVDYNKTETYLSQYFSDISVNPDLYQDAEQVKAAREWTQQYAPMTRKEAFSAIMSVYAEFHTDEQILNDIAVQVVQPHIANLYQQGKTVVGDDLNALRQNLQEKEQQADKGVQAAPKTPLNDKDDMDGRE